MGTARAQQGRLAEAGAAFAAAHALEPTNERLGASLAQMPAQQARLGAMQATLANALPEVCGTPCQDVVDALSNAACKMSWADGCGEAPPPAGFSAASTIAELCAHACAFHLLQTGEAGGSTAGASSSAAESEANSGVELDRGRDRAEPKEEL